LNSRPAVRDPTPRGQALTVHGHKSSRRMAVASRQWQSRTADAPFQPRPISSRFIDPTALTKPNTAQPGADFAVALRDHAPSWPPPPEPPTAPGSDHPAQTL